MKLNEQELKNQLHQWRPASWENDLSLNALDQKKFNNAPSPSRLDQGQLRAIFNKAIPDWLRDGIDIDSMINNDPYPVPGNEDREGYLPDYHERFWISGLDDYLRIRFVLEKHKIRPRNVFEFGAATGRVLRHFVCQGRFATGDPFEQTWCCDINYRHVRWILAYLHPRVLAFHNSTIAHFPLESNSIELACAFSVFTHIDTFELQWISELHRILTPGGIAYITIHNEQSWQELANNPKHNLHSALRKSKEFDPAVLKKPLPADRLVYRFKDDGPYRSNVFHSESHIRNNWSRYFDILEILPLFHSGFQAVVVMRKTA